MLINAECIFRTHWDSSIQLSGANSTLLLSIKSKKLIESLILKKTCKKQVTPHCSVSVIEPTMVGPGENIFRIKVHGRFENAVLRLLDIPSYPVSTIGIISFVGNLGSVIEKIENENSVCIVKSLENVTHGFASPHRAWVR